MKEWGPTLAIILGGAFALWKFVWEDWWVPKSWPPGIVMSTRLEQAGRNGSLIAVRGQINRQNIGRTRVKVLAGWYNISAARVQPAENPSDLYWRGNGTVIRSGVSFDVQKAAFKGPREEYKIRWLDPSQSSSEEIMFYVPERYDLVYLEAATLFGKEDVPRRPEWGKENGKTYASFSDHDAKRFGIFNTWSDAELAITRSDCVSRDSNK